jgi:hypothetical protein
MQKYSTEFISIVESTLVKYIDKCRVKYQDLTNETEIGNRLSNHEFQQFLGTDPMWKFIRVSNQNIQF